MNIVIALVVTFFPHHAPPPPVPVAAVVIPVTTTTTTQPAPVPAPAPQVTAPPAPAPPPVPAAPPNPPQDQAPPNPANCLMYVAAAYIHPNPTGQPQLIFGGSCTQANAMAAHTPGAYVVPQS